MENFPILAYSVTGCIYVSASVSLCDILIDITSSAIGLKICKLFKLKSISQ